MKYLYIILAFFVVVFANEYHDEDLDGVIDSLDRCPHTPFSDIVDEYGCSIERLVKPKKMEYYFEYLYATDKRDFAFKENDYLFSLTIYHGNFDLSINSIYYSNQYNKGFSDINMRLEYKITLTPMWDTYVGVGLDLPTLNVKGNRTDLELYLSNEYYLYGYKLLYGGFYTFTDDTMQKKSLKNGYGGYFGIEGYKEKYLYDLIYLYNRSKFGTVNNTLYLKLEKILKNSYYIFCTLSLGLNSQTIDSIKSIGFGRRF